MVPLLQKKWVNKISYLTLYLVLGAFFQCSYAQIASQKDCPTAMSICDATQSYFFEVTANNIGLIEMPMAQILFIVNGVVLYPTGS